MFSNKADKPGEYKWPKSPLAILVFTLFICFNTPVYAQQPQQVLMVMNYRNGAAFIIRPGSLIAIEYKGYLGQKAYFKGNLDFIRDSLLHLSMRPNLLSRKQHQEVHINDVSGLRHFTLGNQITKASVELILLTGSVYLYTQVLSTAAIAPLARIGIATGSGLFSYGIIKLLFPGKIYVKKEYGWQFMIARETIPQR
jgi:hypothetical protein